MDPTERHANLSPVTPEERIIEIQEALQRRFRAAGHGSISRVQEALDLGDGYFKDQRRPGRRRVDLRVLFRALDELEVDPADFFADALGPADPLAAFRSEAAALARKIKPPRILELEAERDGEGGETIDLAALDQLRLENPKLVIRRAHRLIQRVERRQVPTLLGVYASACRLSDRLEQAHIVLARALELGAEGGDSATLGELLQRASHVAAERSGHRRALELSERATLAYVRAGELAGVGKTLMDRGLWLGGLGQLRRANRAFESALGSYLATAGDGDDVRRHRFSCLMHLGANHLRLGELDAARRFAARAHEHSDGISPAQRGKLMWLRASIAERTGRLGEAQRHFEEAVEIYRPFAPQDAALVAVGLVRVLLLQEKIGEAYETAKSMTRLLLPLEDNRIASAALMELLRCALSGHGLTVALAKRVARGLERANRRAGNS